MTLKWCVKSKQTILWWVQSAAFIYRERLYSSLSRIMVTKCDTSLSQKGSHMPQLTLFTKWQVQIYECNFFNGWLNRGKFSWDSEYTGRLRGALGFVQQARLTESASVLARQPLAETCRHFTFSIFWLALTSYKNNLKFEKGVGRSSSSMLHTWKLTTPMLQLGKNLTKNRLCFKKYPQGFLAIKLFLENNNVMS